MGRSSCRLSIVVFALTATVDLSATGQPALTELLAALELSGYRAEVTPPDFESRTATGRPLSLADLRGRVILLNFWATWCAECRSEMPAFERLHRDFAALGLTVVGVNVREGTEAIQRYAEELDLTFAIVLDARGVITSSYGVIGLPTTFLIGRDGRSVALAVGPRAWDSAPARALIQSLLAEPTAGRRAS
jgi:peroxiredoxin